MKTPREQLTIKFLLAFLAEREGGLVAEAVIHAAVNLQMEPKVTHRELEDAIQFCDSEKWIDSVHSRLNGMRWAITEAGELASKRM